MNAHRLASICASLAALVLMPGVAGAAPTLYVGDSLGAGTVPQLAPMLRLEGDTRIGRTSTEGLSVLRSRLRPRHRVVVFDLGSNDWRAATLTRNLRRARRLTGRRTLVVFTLSKPGGAPFNRAIRSFAASSGHVLLIDWRSTASRERLVAGDRVHAAARGYRRRAALVAGALAGGDEFSPRRPRAGAGTASRAARARPRPRAAPRRAPGRR